MQGVGALTLKRLSKELGHSKRDSMGRKESVKVVLYPMLHGYCAGEVFQARDETSGQY